MRGLPRRAQAGPLVTTQGPQHDHLPSRHDPFGLLIEGAGNRASGLRPSLRTLRPKHEHEGHARTVSVIDSARRPPHSESVRACDRDARPSA